MSANDETDAELWERVHDFERTTVNLFQGHRQPSQSDRMAMYKGIL